MTVTEFGMVIEVRVERLKARAPMEVYVSGIITAPPVALLTRFAAAASSSSVAAEKLPIVKKDTIKKRKNNKLQTG